MNLLVDGWCQIVGFTEIPGQPQPDKGAVVHQVGAKQELAIWPPFCRAQRRESRAAENPRKRRSYIRVQHIAGNQPAHCGLAKSAKTPHSRWLK
jgi:hypothetical protein